MLAAFCTERRNIEEKKKKKKKKRKKKSQKNGRKEEKNLKAAGNLRAPIGCGAWPGCVILPGHTASCTLASVTCVWLEVWLVCHVTFLIG